MMDGGAPSDDLSHHLPQLIIDIANISEGHPSTMTTITILGVLFIRPFPPEEYLINPSVIGGYIISSFLQLPFRAKKAFESLKASTNPEVREASVQEKCSFFLTLFCRELRFVAIYALVEDL